MRPRFLSMVVRDSHAHLKTNSARMGGAFSVPGSAVLIGGRSGESACGDLQAASDHIIGSEAAQVTASGRQSPRDNLVLERWRCREMTCVSAETIRVRILSASLSAPQAAHRYSSRCSRYRVAASIP